MTVSDYLKSLVWGLDMPDVIIERAANSPREVSLEALDVDDEAYPDDPSEDDFQKRLDYAASTVYYAVLGVFSHGSSSEQVGDVRVSKGAVTITQSDRDRFKMLADELRKKWGFDIRTDEASSEMCDVSYLRR